MIVSHLRREPIYGFTYYSQMMQHCGLQDLIGKKRMLGRTGDD